MPVMIGPDTPARVPVPRWIRWTLVALGLAAFAALATVAEGILLWYLIVHYALFHTP